VNSSDKDFVLLQIILTIRDEDSWYKSLLNQIRILNNSYFAWFANGFTYSGFIRLTYQQTSSKCMTQLSFERSFFISRKLQQDKSFGWWCTSNQCFGL